MSITEVKGPGSDAEFKPAGPKLEVSPDQNTAPASTVTEPAQGPVLDLTGTEPVIDLRDKPAETPPPAPAEPHVETPPPAQVTTGQHVEHAPAGETTQAVDATSNQAHTQVETPAPQRKGIIGFIKGIFSHDEQNDLPVYPPVESGMGAGFDPATMATEQRAAAKAQSADAAEVNKEQ